MEKSIKQAFVESIGSALRDATKKAAHRGAIITLSEEVDLDIIVHLAYTSVMKRVPYDTTGRLATTLYTKMLGDICYYLKAKRFQDGSIDPENFSHDLYKLHTGISDKRLYNGAIVDWMLNTDGINVLLRDDMSRLEVSQGAIDLINAVERTLSYVIENTMSRFLNVDDTFFIKQEKAKSKKYVCRTSAECRENKYYGSPAVAGTCDVNVTPGSVISKAMEDVRHISFNMDHQFNELVLEAIKSDRYIKEHTNGKNRIDKALWDKYQSALRSLTYGIEDWEAVGCKPFYMTYKFDFRGRITPMGNLSPTSSKLVRGCLRSGTKAKLGETGHNELKMAYAAYTELPKGTFNDRLVWTNERMVEALNRGRILSETNEESISLLLDMINADMESPVRAAGVAIELWRVNQFDGKVEDFESDVFITVDGSNNAAQHYSLAAKNPELATQVNCNVDDSTEDKIHDFYSKLTEEMVAQSLVEPKPNTNPGLPSIFPYMKWYRDLNCLRKVSKRLLMPRMYGSAHSTWVKNVKEILDEKKWIDTLKPNSLRRYCGVDEESRDQFVRGFAEAIARLFQKVYDKSPTFKSLKVIETYLKDVAKAYTQAHNAVGKKGMHMRWVSPQVDGYVTQKFSTYYMKPKMFNFDTIVGGKREKVTVYGVVNAIFRNCEDDDMGLKTDRCMDVAKTQNACPPSIIHSRDAFMMHRTIAKAQDEFGRGSGFNMCHDSMAVTAGDSRRLREILKEEWVEMYGGTGNVFETLSKQCKEDTGTWVNFPEPVIEDMTEGLLRADYSFA